MAHAAQTARQYRVSGSELSVCTSEFPCFGFVLDYPCRAIVTSR
jgi:hypothetical protein